MSAEAALAGLSTARFPAGLLPEILQQGLLCRIGGPRSGEAGVPAEGVARPTCRATPVVALARPVGGADVCHGVCVGEDLWDAYDRMGLSFQQHAADSAYNAHYDRPAVLAALGPVTGRQVLDAACGPGLYLRELLERGAEVTAFDASPVMVSLARQQTAGRVRIGFVKLEWPHCSPLIGPRPGGGWGRSSPLIWPRLAAAVLMAPAGGWCGSERDRPWRVAGGRVDPEDGVAHGVGERGG